MTAPTVTNDQVHASIAGETYTILPDGRTTICQLTLKNGFTVDGHSACVSKDNFDKAKGEKYAKEQAVEKIWAYLGWDLCTKLNQMNGAGDATGLILKLGQPLTYVGTKVVRGLPMNRLAYNDLRGWDLPKDEDGSDEGYLVEYVDGGTPNVPGFTGYISWSPKDVFERAYGTGVEIKPGTFKDRLLIEHDQLNERFKKLSLFLGSSVFNALEQFEQDDLEAQHVYMRGYLGVLNRRIFRLG